MSGVMPFAFDEQLVRVVSHEGEPWFVGRDVAAALHIRDHKQALETLDQDERGRCCVPTPGGQQEAIIISEPGVYRLVFRSRKPEAERFKRWLAHDVLPALRKSGHYAATPPPPIIDPPRDPEQEAMMHRLNVVREARLLFGPDRARSLWRQLGLPAVPPPPATPRDEAWACLRHILDAQIGEGQPRVRDLLRVALEDGEEERLMLHAVGVRALPETDAFVIANRHAGLQRLLQRSAWPDPMVAMRILRRLPGATACGTMLPGDLLDEDATELAALRTGA